MNIQERKASMNAFGSLLNLPKWGAEYIQEFGWVQKVERDAAGRVCLTGALRLCSPVPGDGHIACAIFRHRGHAEDWNDDPIRTEQEVIEYLIMSEITDDDLADTFGPQWPEIVAQVRLIAVVTPEQIKELVAGWDAARDDTSVAAWAAARSAAYGDAMAATMDAVRSASWDASWGIAWDPGAGSGWSVVLATVWADARSVTRDAALGLVTRDLIGTGGYTQEHYDKLTAPWVSVFGKIHPDDRGGKH